MSNTTNNPWQDNWERAHKKRLAETSKRLRLRNSNGSRTPRKRKKEVHLIERKNYAELVDAVFRDKVKDFKNYYLIFPVKKGK